MALQVPPFTPFSTGSPKPGLHTGITPAEISFVSALSHEEHIPFPMARQVRGKASDSSVDPMAS